MLLKLLAASILLAGMARGPQTLRLQAPDHTTLESVTQAAQMLAIRCRSYGYKGIQTRVFEERDRKYVDVVCDTGFTSEMEAMVRIFGFIRAASIEIRFPYERTEVEEEQFQPGSDPAQDKAPVGARWFRFWVSKHPPILLRETPVVLRQDLLLSRRKNRYGVEQLICEISKTRTREIFRADLRRRLGTPVLILDGLVLQPVVLSRREIDRDNKRVGFAERASFTPYGSGLREILLNPLPIQLKLKSAETSEPPSDCPHASARQDERGMPFPFELR